LDDKDKELIRYLANRYRNRTEKVHYDAFVEEMKVPRSECATLRTRMLMLGMIAELDNCDFVVLPECAELVNDWDNPPPRDYWEQATKWMRCRRWTLPLLVLAAALPLIKGYWDIITLVLQCIYPSSKK